MAVGIEFEFFHAALPDEQNRFLVSASFVSRPKARLFPLLLHIIPIEFPAFFFH
jgi:hypothetical protein